MTSIMKGAAKWSDTHPNHIYNPDKHETIGIRTSKIHREKSNKNFEKKIKM